MTSPRWMERAACVGREGEYFFAPDHETPKAKEHRITQAKAICAGCIVRDECLAYALKNDEEHGIWGGLTEKELGAMRVRRPRIVELKHGTAWAAQRHRNRGEEPCGICKDAVNRKMADWKRRPLASDDPRHGKWSTYVNFGCRCPACKEANSQAGKARYKRMKEQSA